MPFSPMSSSLAVDNGNLVPGATDSGIGMFVRSSRNSGAWSLMSLMVTLTVITSLVPNSMALTSISQRADEPGQSSSRSRSRTVVSSPVNGYQNDVVLG